jgi:hypothetical protein
MPLLPDAIEKIRANLEQVRDGQKPKLVVIGRLTQAQMDAINARRAEQGLLPIVDEVVFIGKHVYRSRITGNLYTIEDVIEQICSAMRYEATVVHDGFMTGLESPSLRADRYGNQVVDRVVFECTSKHPRPELFSVIPKGDKIKPTK